MKTIPNIPSSLARRLCTLIAAASLSLGAMAAPPLDALGVQVGSKHKIVLGLGAYMATVILIGSDGWIAVEIDEDGRATGILKGTKFWVNLNAVQAISAPFN